MTDQDEFMQLNVVWPDTIGGIAVETDGQPVGLLVMTSGEDVLRIAHTPEQARLVAALWLNLSDQLDAMEAATAG